MVCMCTSDNDYDKNVPHNAIPLDIMPVAFLRLFISTHTAFCSIQVIISTHVLFIYFPFTCRVAADVF